VEALGGNPGAPGLDPTRYTKRAARACGKHVADLSWAVFVTFPNAPTADSAVAAVFVARTQAGWRPWFVVSPETGTGSFVPR
jgi:hypothetical protein